MNFEIHKRVIMGTVGAILVLALMAGGAYAEPGKGKGPQGPKDPQGPKEKGPQLSMQINNWCSVSDNYVLIDSEITDESGDPDDLFDITLDSRTIYTFAFNGKDEIGKTTLFELIEVDGKEVARVDLCTIMYEDGYSFSDVSAVKPRITLQFKAEGSPDKSYTSGCDNKLPEDPEQDLIDESDLDISKVSC